jgi:hypothetical protein
MDAASALAIKALWLLGHTAARLFAILVDQVVELLETLTQKLLTLCHERLSMIVELKAPIVGVPNGGNALTLSFARVEVDYSSTARSRLEVNYKTGWIFGPANIELHLRLYLCRHFIRS